MGPILAAADTNAAVDNMVAGLLERDVRVVRMGQPAKVGGLCWRAGVGSAQRSSWRCGGGCRCWQPLLRCKSGRGPWHAARLVALLQYAAQARNVCGEQGMAGV